MAIKFKREVGLNEKATELLNYYTIWKSMKEDDPLRTPTQYYIAHKLKFDISEFDNYANERDFEAALYSNKRNLITEKEQIESSKKFADNILDFDRLQISAKTDARSKVLILIKKVGLNNTTCQKMFDNYTDRMFKSGFVENFVDCYMRKNAKTYFSAVPRNNFEIKFSDKYLSDFNYYNFDIEFHIKIDDLDDEILLEIGKIIMNMPQFA